MSDELDCCEKYLKPGETPAERIQREIDGCLALMKLLEKKQRQIEELEGAVDWQRGRAETAEAKLAKAVEALDRIQDGSYGKLAAIARTTLAELEDKIDGNG